MVPDYRFIAIPPADDVTLSAYLDQCRAAEDGGATSLQLRAKHKPAGELVEWAEQMCRVVSVPVYVNDRADVARAAGAAGVHLGADDLPMESARLVVPPPLKLGVSVGNRDEAGRASMAEADYWSLGPFNLTRSKSDAGAPLGADGFRRLADLAPPGVPCVAIGGIGVDDVDDVLGAGAQGVAVISALFSAPDVTRAARAFRDRLDAGLAG